MRFSLFFAGVLLIDTFVLLLSRSIVIDSIDVFDGALADQGRSMLALTHLHAKTPLGWGSLTIFMRISGPLELNCKNTTNNQTPSERRKRAAKAVVFKLPQR